MWGKPDYKYAGTEDILEAIRYASPVIDHVEIPEIESDDDIIYDRPVNWIGWHYVIKVPVENVHFMIGNLWNFDHAAGLVLSVRDGWNRAFEVPAARAYMITPEDVVMTNAYYDSGELEYQMDMVEPWEPSDIGSYHVQLLDGNHRAAAAMVLGASHIYVYVSENYRGNVNPNDWIVK